MFWLICWVGWIRLINNGLLVLCICLEVDVGYGVDWILGVGGDVDLVVMIDDFFGGWWWAHDFGLVDV